jgi:hypothetical protein
MPPFEGTEKVGIIPPSVEALAVVAALLGSPADGGDVEEVFVGILVARFGLRGRTLLGRLL